MQPLQKVQKMIPVKYKKNLKLWMVNGYSTSTLHTTFHCSRKEASAIQNNPPYEFSDICLYDLYLTHLSY